MSTHEYNDTNHIVIEGTLATPPEHRVLDTGEGVTRLLVTVRTTQPRRRVDVLPVAYWTDRTGADDALLDAQAGDRVLLWGSAQRRFWEGRMAGAHASRSWPLRSR